MRNYLIVTLIIFSIINLNSQEVDLMALTEKEGFKLIDKYIDDKDESILTIIGSLDISSSRYNLFEDYLILKIEKLISSGDFSFSLNIIETLLYNNLESESAQKLYTIVINKKIENQERLEAEKALAERNREELSDLTNEIVVKIDHEEFMADVVSNNHELLDIISTYTDSYYDSNYETNFYLYPFTTKYYSSEVYDGYTSRDTTVNSFTGQGLDLGIGMDLSIFRFRTDISMNLTYDDLLYETLKQITGSANFSVGLSNIDFPIFLRSGFLYYLYLYNDNDFSDVAITNLPSPTIGLGISGLRVFNVFKLDIYGDFLMAPTYTKNLDSGLFGKVYLTLNIFRFGGQSLELKGGFDTLYLVEGGLVEYSITPRFGIGISSYE